MLNFARALSEPEPGREDRLAIMAGFHDLPVALDGNLIYLERAAGLADDYLTNHGHTGWSAHGHRAMLKSRAICADSSPVKTIPFTALHVQNDTVAAMSDLVVDPQRCEGAVLFHQNRRVMVFPARRPSMLARSRAKERAVAELYLPPGSLN